MLDGAVLVISAVEGVQAQTRVLMRTLRRLGIPTLIFVNKIDRSGAQDVTLLQSIADKLRLAVLPMGTVTALGTRQAAVTPYAGTDGPHVARLAELLAEQDEAFLTRYLDDQPVPFAELRRGLARLTRHGRTHPVFFGSAITGAGVDCADRGADRAAARPGPATRTRRWPAPSSRSNAARAGRRSAYVRLFAGTVQHPGPAALRRRPEGKVTALSVFARGRWCRPRSISRGPDRQGLGAGRRPDRRLDRHRQAPETHWFAPPTLETVVTAGARPGSRRTCTPRSASSPSRIR